MSELTKYPYDPTGKSATNKVADEEHKVEGTYKRVIVPHHAPFFLQGLKIVTKSGRPLTPDLEYKAIYLHREATEATGAGVYTAIIILNELLIDDLLVSYQTVGGEIFSTVASAIHEAIQALDSISLEVHWDDIKFKPEEYNPADHKHHSRDLIGMKETVEALHGVEQAIRERIVLGIESRVSNLGHTKLIVDEGHLKIESATGPVVLTFGRSTKQEGRISLNLEMMSDFGTAGLNITAEEVENGFDHVSYSATGPAGFNLPVALFAKDGYNHVVIGDDDTPWFETFLHVRSLTTSSLEVDEYQHNWVWRYADDGEVFPDRVVPASSNDLIESDLQNIQTSVIALANLLNQHLHDFDNPHELTAEDIDLGNVENFEASTNYQDDSETLYATAKSVSDLDDATSAEIAQSAEDLLAAIELALDRGYTF